MGERQLPELYPGWRTVRKIGSGSFGTVYEIERDLFGKIEKAALKCITIPQNDGDVEELYSNGYDDASITAHFETYLANIVREYSLMAEMKGHTNVVYCDDIRYVPREDGIGWDITIKMELLTPLLKALGPDFGEEQIIRLGKDLCRALALCKNRDIVHRDIKPQNIFVSKTGDYKLGDFGIAKTVEQTTGGTKIGTYSYMAPEVYHNKPYGSSADIYSLGLVMYWLLNERRLPFLPLPPKSPTYNETEMARHRRFMGEAIPAPKNGSEELKRIVLKACAFDPQERFASAQEMLDALEGMGQAEPVVNKVEVQEESVRRLDESMQVWSRTVPAEPDEDKTVGIFSVSEPVGEIVQKSEHEKDNAWNQMSETMTLEDATQGPVFEPAREAEKDKTANLLFEEWKKRKQDRKKQRKGKLMIGTVIVLLCAFLYGSTWTGWVRFMGNTYYVKNGVKQTQWQTIDGNRYYSSLSNGGALATGKWKIDDAYYYFGEDGVMITEPTEIEENTIYYFDEDGCFRYCDITKKDVLTTLSNEKVDFPQRTGGSAWGHYQELIEPIENCGSLDVELTISEVKYGDCDGKWQVHIRMLDGNWIRVGTFDVCENTGSFSTTFEDQISFDAVICTGYNIGDYSAQCYVELKNIIYRSNDFGEGVNTE